MSEQISSQAAVSGSAYVAQYLSEHPDFFQQHRELLTILAIPHDAGAISLVERQVKALRDKNRDLQGQLIDMLRNARDNERLLVDVVEVLAKAVHAKSLQELAEILRHEMHQYFGTDAEMLLVCGQGDAVPPLRRVAHAELLEGVQCGFPDAAPVCGAMDAQVRQYVFGGFKDELRSVALIPLGQLGKHGILAIASADKKRFTAEMGTLFLEMLAQVVGELVIKLR